MPMQEMENQPLHRELDKENCLSQAPLAPTCTLPQERNVTLKSQQLAGNFTFNIKFYTIHYNAPSLRYKTNTL